MTLPRAGRRAIEVMMAEARAEGWEGVPCVRVGDESRPDLPPDAVVHVRRAGAPELVVEVQRGPDEYHCFGEAVAWAGWVVIGHGERVHFVGPEGRVVSHALAETDPAYFVGFAAEGGVLLATSGGGVFRFGVDAGLLWCAPGLGIDGVLLSGVEDGEVHGRGDWDPPSEHGWCEFRLDLETGAVLSRELPWYDRLPEGWSFTDPPSAPAGG